MGWTIIGRAGKGGGEGEGGEREVPREGLKALIDRESLFFFEIGEPYFFFVSFELKLANHMLTFF